MQNINSQKNILYAILKGDETEEVWVRNFPAEDERKLTKEHDYQRFRLFVHS